MRFEPITLCPVSLKGINPDMLTEQEREWLNTYHKCFRYFVPYLDDEKEPGLKRTLAVFKIFTLLGIHSIILSLIHFIKSLLPFQYDDS